MGDHTLNLEPIDIQSSHAQSNSYRNSSFLCPLPSLVPTLLPPSTSFPILSLVVTLSIRLGPTCCLLDPLCIASQFLKIRLDILCAHSLARLRKWFEEYAMAPCRA
jgi:hypothetical protein